MASQYFEVEQKYRISRPAGIRRRLKEIGARRLRGGREYNELFDLGNRLRRKKSILRLRRNSYGAWLTFKGPQLGGKYKKRREAETAVDFKQAKEILKLLGYKTLAVYSKKREEYRFLKTTVVLDFLPARGWFLEIEGNPRSIGFVERKLGLGRGDREERTYLQILGFPDA